MCIGLVALLLPAGATLAAIPGPDGTISACYDSTLLNLRVRDTADPGTDCDPASETALNWSQSGPLSKQVRSVGLTSLPVSGTVNILSITFTTPRAGFALTNANGYCNALSPASGGSGVAFMGISTVPTSTGEFPQAFVRPPQGLSNIGGWQIPWSTSSVFPVGAGANTLYVNAGSSNAGGWSCAAILTVEFSGTQLP